MAVVLLTLLTTSLVFADEVCNYYDSNGPQLSARISVNGNEASIDVRSYVGHERIAIYQVEVDGVTFGEWDIRGNLIIDEMGSTNVKVTNTDHVFDTQYITSRYYFKSNPSVTVWAKTCD